MRRVIATGIGFTLFASSIPTLAQPVAGRAVLGVEVTELDAVMAGWSATKTLLGKPVYNDRQEKVGKIEDIIVTPEHRASYAIIGVGGFLKLGERYVAIPMNQLNIQHKKIFLPGATREQVKAMPRFEYQKTK
jgi:sporulation protein YlmC with PRC-barrel domain